MDFPKTSGFPGPPNVQNVAGKTKNQEALERLRLRLGISAEVQRMKKMVY